MSGPLVIVESPAKARTIAGFLGDDVVVESSVGHIRDLPRNAAEVPEQYKRSWEILAVDVDADFKPVYIVHTDKKSKVKELRSLLKQADELYLATDEDREGEAIAWHLLEVLNPPAGMPVRRMQSSRDHPPPSRRRSSTCRDLDRRRRRAGGARLLTTASTATARSRRWCAARSRPGPVGGPVQSVAALAHRRGRGASMAFVSASYWDLDGAHFARPTRRSVASAPRWWRSTNASPRQDFDAGGASHARVWSCSTRPASKRWRKRAAPGAVQRPFRRRRKPCRRRPAAPFATSTLQQEGGSQAAAVVGPGHAQAAQSLYESSCITTCVPTAPRCRRRRWRRRAPRSPTATAPSTSRAPARQYTKKVKNAQEAHEASAPPATSSGTRRGRPRRSTPPGASARMI
ncbi:MAG: toprim domain-containing protein [Acidimicrobiales bacterium]